MRRVRWRAAALRSRIPTHRGQAVAGSVTSRQLGYHACVAAITVDHRSPFVVVQVAGELDISSAPRLAEMIAQSPENARLVVDLSETTFVGSTGASVLIHNHQRLTEAGGELRIVLGGHRSTRLVFSTLGLESVLLLYENMAAALAE